MRERESVSVCVHHSEERRRAETKERHHQVSRMRGRPKSLDRITCFCEGSSSSYHTHPFLFLFLTLVHTPLSLLRPSPYSLHLPLPFFLKYRLLLLIFLSFSVDFSGNLFHGPINRVHAGYLRRGSVHA